MKTKMIGFYGRTYMVTDYERVTKSKKTLRPKYSECMLCPETRYVTRHHVTRTVTVPICPMCHFGVNIGDIKIEIVKKKAGELNEV